MPPSRRTRIDRVLEQQDADLQLLEDEEAERFLVVYEAARRDLRERVGALERTGDDEVLRFTAQHMRVMLAQAEAGIQQMQWRLDRQIEDSTRRAQEEGFKNLIGMIKAAEPDFRDTGNRIEHQVLRRFQEERGLLVHRYSTQRYSADVLQDIQRELSLGVATGRTIPQMRDRLYDQVGSEMAHKRARAELIARMELNSAYNKGHQAAGEEAVQVLDGPEGRDVREDDPLVKRADEFRDMRNHAISRALHNQVVPVHEPFRVTHAAVQAEHVLLQAERAARKLSTRSLSGIVWLSEGGLYVGMTHPAHYGDRGRQVLVRESWGPTRPAPPMPTRPSSKPNPDAKLRA